MKRILVTGFGRFGNVKVNASEVLAKHLAKIYPDIHVHVFRTSYKAVEEQLPRILKKFKPETVVMFGYAGKSSLIRLEKHAKLPANLKRNSGNTYKSTLPLTKIYDELTKFDVGVTYSEDAGHYVCNYLFFRMGELASAYKITQYGFIHLPSPEKYEADVGRQLNLITTGKAVMNCVL